jgi:site-specific DNA-methyltransferase (adenine-specific)
MNNLELNKIYCESNLETMARMPDGFVDLILTSPPYNIIRPNSTDRGYDLYKDGMSNDEYIEWTLSMFSEFNRVLKNNSIVLYNMSYGTENTELMSLLVADIIRKSDFTLADIIVWKKQSATPNNVSHNKMTRIVEFVYVFCRKTEIQTFSCNKKSVNKRDTGQLIYENVFNFIYAPNNDSSVDLNKATFSTVFARKLLDMYAKEKSIVYDPFMGTGTTAKACVIDKHFFIGSEISNNQVDYANKRLKPYLDQTTLF